MNAMLLQLIAAQASTGRNSRMAEAMARVQAISANNPGMDPRELLAQLGNNNPMVNMLLKQLNEQQQNAAKGNEAPVIDVEAVQTVPELPNTVAPDAAPDSEAVLQQIRQEMESMRTEVQVLRERNDLFAAALGACCLCWGQDLSCRSCRGRGGPGFSMPDESLFGEYVVPALQTLQARKTKFKKPSPEVLPGDADSEIRLRQAANY